jgi:hypothetical protein
MKERKTGTIIRQSPGCGNCLNKVSVKRKYVELWNEGCKKPKKILATEYYRKALREENWNVFEDIIACDEAWQMERLRKRLYPVKKKYYLEGLY